MFRKTHRISNMSLRDWFAGQVLAGHWTGRLPDDITTPTAEDVATACYDLADAMLKKGVNQ